MADAENCRAGQASRDGPASAWHREVWPDLGSATAIVSEALDVGANYAMQTERRPDRPLRNRGRPSGHTETTRDHINVEKRRLLTAKEDRIKTRPRPDPRKPLRPDLSQMCQKGLPGRLSTMADPRATLVLFPSPVVRPIPSRSSRGSPWQQTVACRALPCCGRGQLRSIIQQQLNSGTAVSSLSPATACGRKWSVGRHGLMMLTDDPPTPSWRAKQGRI